MEKYLFKLYANYIKETCPTGWERFQKLPISLKIKWAMMLALTVLSIVFIFLAEITDDTRTAMWLVLGGILSLVMMFVFCGVVSSSTEKYEIEISYEKMQDYWGYCRSFRHWFKVSLLGEQATEEQISNSIREVKQRIDSYICIQNDNNEKRIARIDKWVQALLIPFILAIITGVINKSDSPMEEVSTYIFLNVILYSLLVGGVWSIWNSIKLMQKNKLEQMKSFSDDLQGALDCVKYTQGIRESNDNHIIKE